MCIFYGKFTRENLLVDTNALIYLYEIVYKKQSIKFPRNRNDFNNNQDYVNKFKGRSKRTIICSESYFEYLCHCYKNNTRQDFFMFYDFINKFCKKEQGQLPEIINTKEYYEFDTKKLEKDYGDNKVDYKSYVEKRINAECKLIKNFYIPLICAMKNILSTIFPQIELYEESDNEMVTLIDESIGEMLHNYYNTPNSSIEVDECINIPISIFIEKYKNINHSDYKTIQELKNYLDVLNIRDSIIGFLKKVSKMGKKEFNVIKSDFYKEFCEYTKFYRQRNNEYVMYDYVDYLTKKILEKKSNSKKFYKNDIIDMSIISTFSIYLDNYTQPNTKNTLITFDKTMYNFVKDKQNESTANVSFYNKINL